MSHVLWLYHGTIIQILKNYLFIIFEKEIDILMGKIHPKEAHKESNENYTLNKQQNIQYENALVVI